MLKFAFNFFDKDNNGLITIEEILKLFKNNKYNDNDSSNEIKKIMKMIDKNDDGDINFEEFSQFMKKLLEQL
jgi:calcium-dependent protein kinase